MRVSLKWAFLLGFVGFVTSFGAHIVAVNLPFYAENVGVSLVMIGVLIAAYDFAEILAKPVFGGLADKKGMKPALLAGVAVFILASLLYPLVSPRLLVVIRFLQGLGAAALSAVSLAMVGTLYQEGKGKAFGVYNAIKGAGYVVSPLVGGVIVQRSNFGGIFYASALVGALAFLVSLLLPGNRKGGAFEEEEEEFSIKGLLRVFANPSLLPWFLVIVINMFFVGILFGFLPVRLHNLGYNAIHTALVVSVATTSYVLIQPISGWLADRFNAVLVIRLGMLLSCITTVLIPFTQDGGLVVVCLLAGAAIGTVWTNTDALVSQLATRQHMGATMGAAGSFKEFGDMVGPLLMGVLSQAWGLRAGFMTCSVLGLLALLLTIFFKGGRARKA